MKLKKGSRLMSYTLVFMMLIMTLNPVYAAEQTNFTDVEGHWAEPEITQAHSEELVEGYPDNTFQPNKEITRAEFMTLMNRFLYLKEMAEDNYLDVNETDWFSKETAKAKQINYILGDYARPKERSTREEVVNALAELLDIQGKASTKTFTDLKGLSEESKQSINGLVEKGYLNGYPDKTFKPNGTITRAEILKMFNNALGKIVRNNGALNGINEIEGNLTIVNTGINLEGKTIKGDLYISPGALDKINLENLKVTGRIIISGGSKSTPIKLDNVKAKEITIRKTTGKANIEITGKSEIEKITTKTEAKIETQQGTIIKEMVIQGEAAGTQITGEGKITKATIDAEEVIIEQKVSQVEVTKNAESAVVDGRTKKYKSSSSSSSSSSGSSSGSSSSSTVAVAAIAEMAGNNNADGLTVAMLETAGATDVVADYLAEYKISVVDDDAVNVDELIEIQALIDVVNAYERVDETFDADATVNSGATVTLTVPTGYTAWFAPAKTDDDAFVEGLTMTTAAAGATSITAPTDLGDYKFYLIRESGVAYEGMYTLTVSGIDDAEAPTITSDLTNVSTPKDTAITLDAIATVSDGGTVTYAWYKADDESKTNPQAIAGATSATYAPAVDATGTFYYYCVVTNTNNAATGTKIAETTSAVSTVTVNAVVTEFDGGIGIVDDPFRITKLEHLNNVRNYLGDIHADKHFKLMNNLDFDTDSDYQDVSNKASWTTGEGWMPIGNSGTLFTGKFNGNGNTISGLRISRSNDVGLFGFSKGTIENLGLIDVLIHGVTNIGGLVGSLEEGTITNSYVTGDVNGDDSVGGLVGRGYMATITNSYATVVVVGSVGDSVVGGAGGLVGSLFFSSTIKDSYATGNVHGSVDVGGLVGLISDATITNCIAFNIEIIRKTSSVETNFHRIIGRNYGTLTNNYANDNMSLPSGITATSDANGVDGENITAGDFKNSSSTPFTNWDFTDIWEIKAGADRPTLRGVGSDTGIIYKAVTGVSLNKTSTTLIEGATETLTATVAPANATNKNVTWSSYNTGIATVDSNGLVTAVVAGTTVITVTTEDGSKTATFVVDIVPKAVESIAVTTNPTKTQYVVGQAIDLTGLVVTATYNDASTGVVSVNTSNISGFNSTAPAVGQIVTVTVDGKTATFTVNIVAAPASNVTTVTTINTAVVTAIDNTVGSEDITVAYGKTVNDLLNAIQVDSGVGTAKVTKGGVEVAGGDAVIGTMLLEVTAEDGTTFNLYTITVEPAPASNVTTVTLSDPFYSDSITAIDNTVGSERITVVDLLGVTSFLNGIQVDAGAGTFKLFTDNGKLTEAKDDVTVTFVTATMVLEVTAEDGTTVVNYAITVQ